MKLKQKMVALLAVLSSFGFLSSCRGGTVTLTLNAGVGTFGTNAIIQRMIVNKGTRLSDVIVTNPTFEFSYSDPLYNDAGRDDSIYCSHWTINDENNTVVPNNYVINDNIELILNELNDDNCIMFIDNQKVPLEIKRYFDVLKKIGEYSPFSSWK